MSTRLRSAEPTQFPSGPLLAVGGCVLLLSVAAFFRVPLLPDMGRELSMSAAQLGLLTTCFAVGRLAADIPAGRFTDVVPVSVMFGAAGVALAVGSALLAAAQTAALAIAAAFVLGVASSVTNTTGMWYFSVSAPPERRGVAMAGFSSALLGGQALGPLAGGLLAGLGTWRTAVAIAAAVGAVMAVPLLVHGVRQRARRAREPAAPAGEAQEQTAAQPAAAVVPRSELWTLYSVAFVMFFTLGAMPQTLVPLIGAEDFGLGAALIGVALGAGGACRFVGGLAGGILSDRVSRRAALIPGLVVQAIGVALLAVGRSVAWWVSAIIVMSLASFSISVAATVLADRVQARSVGGVFGTFRFVGDLGLIAGPFLASLLFERVSKTASVVLVTGLLGACAVACGFLVPEPARSARAGDR